MNKKTEHLLDKYWNADSTLEEENELRQHFQKHEPGDSPEAALFAFFEEQRQTTFQKPVAFKPRHRFIQMRYLLSIAASVIILSIAYFSFTFAPQSARSNHRVIDNPEEALQVTLDALSIVNGSLEKGEQKVLKGMHHLDKTFIFKS